MSGISGIKNCLLLTGAMFCLSACNSMQELAQIFVDENRAGGTFGFGKEEPAHQTIDMSGYLSNEDVEVYSMEKTQPVSTGKRRTLPPMEPVYRDNLNGYSATSPRQATRETMSYGRPPVRSEYTGPQEFRPQSAEQRGLPSTDSSVMLYPLEDTSSAYPVPRPMYPEQRPPQHQQRYQQQQYQQQQYQQQQYQQQYQQQPYGAYGQRQPSSGAVPPTGAYVPGGPQAMYGYHQSPQAAPLRTLPARIYFGHGKTGLDEAAREVLASVAEDVKRRRDVSLRVEGYASSRAGGNDEARRAANMKTSRTRAQSVADELIRLGVPESAIQATGYGDTVPVTAKDGVSTEDASRRVEIHQIR